MPSMHKVKNECRKNELIELFCHYLWNCNCAFCLITSSYIKILRIKEARSQFCDRKPCKQGQIIIKSKGPPTQTKSPVSC